MKRRESLLFISLSPPREREGEYGKERDKENDGEEREENMEKREKEE